MKIVRGVALFLAFLCLTSCLTACQLMDKLGFDTYDYMSEKVVVTHAADSETAEVLESFLQILITDSPYLATFENMSDAIRLYRDAVLTYMLDTGYAKYSGNTELLAKAEQEYPEYNITQIIPESEFEATMYRCFGGNVMLTHRDGERFKYLSKVGAYISPVTPTSSGLTADITALSETDKTYRVHFKVVGDDISSEEYFALVIKREDGTLYIKKLMEGSAIKD